MAKTTTSVTAAGRSSFGGSIRRPSGALACEHRRACGTDGLCTDSDAPIPSRPSIDRYRGIINLQPRERVPLDWAATQNNLGFALWKLGERERGTAKLEEAVAAYREALKEYTRERVPLG